MLSIEEYKERISEKFGSCENFWNITENSLEEENVKGNIDKGMYQVCKHFCEIGYKTVMSCNGHGKSLASISFSTHISKYQLYHKLEGIENVYPHIIRHKCGFEYVKVEFLFNEEVIDNLLKVE